AHSCPAGGQPRADDQDPRADDQDPRTDDRWPIRSAGGRPRANSVRPRVLSLGPRSLALDPWSSAIRHPPSQALIPRASSASQSPRLGLDQSDQSSAIAANVPAVFAASRARPRGVLASAFAPLGPVRRASSCTLTRTSPPSTPQNSASGALKAH